LLVAVKQKQSDGFTRYHIRQQTSETANNSLDVRLRCHCARYFQEGVVSAVVLSGTMLVLFCHYLSVHAVVIVCAAAQTPLTVARCLLLSVPRAFEFCASHLGLAAGIFSQFFPARFAIDSRAF
jgi:hypothetical protein